MTTVLDTLALRADAVPEPAPQPEPSSPARPIPPEPQGPRADVDRVDALDCRGPAMHDVGGRRVCEAHYLEVLHAYWEARPDLILHHYDEPRGRCGEQAERSWS